MNTEVITALNRINEIQDYFANSYLSFSEKTEYRKEWKVLFDVMRKNSVRIRRRKVRNQHKWIWKIVDVDIENPNRESDSCWVKFAPLCDHKNECTTRALFFCLDGAMEYDAIRKEQNRKARIRFGRGRCFGWNISSVWETVLSERGYTKIVLRYDIRRDKLANMLKNYGRILTHSSHHCAAIMGGKVYDSWDSSRGRVDYILVKKEYAFEVRKICGGI